MGEHEVQQAVLKKWGAHPKVRLWRTNAGRAFVETPTGMRPITVNIPGLGDLTGWVTVDGIARFLTIEMKSEKGRLRESQKVFRRVLLAMGGIHIVARSVEDVDRELGRYV